MVAAGLFLSGALFAINFQPSSEVLGAAAPPDDTTTPIATDDATAAITTTPITGFCCHYAPDKKDTCGSCLARQTTGTCSADSGKHNSVSPLSNLNGISCDCIILICAYVN